MASKAAWILGGLVVAGAAGTAIYFATRPKETAKAPASAPLIEGNPPAPGGTNGGVAQTQTNVPELNALADLAQKLNAINWTVPPPPPIG